MVTKPQAQPILLRWSAHIPFSDVQDPLGLGLRGSTRLASRLLYCITSITPRARYFSFIPWCIFDHGQREKGKSHASGLRDGIVFREQALTLACIAHHEGDQCAGGGLVGSRDAKKWFAKDEKEANFKKMKRFSKNPALGAYLNSIVNLGLFVTETVAEDSDEEAAEEDFQFDDIELSSLGLNLAKGFDLAVGDLSATRQIASKDRNCTISDLATFGQNAGLCEVSDQSAPDRDILRDIFFALADTKGESHKVRRQSLLLMLELCRQYSADDLTLDDETFSSAVYFGEVVHDDIRFAVVVPPELRDIAHRWRMFYFHHYMSVALEGLLSWLVSQLGSSGLAGRTLDSLVGQFDQLVVGRDLVEITGVTLKGSFGNLSPATLIGRLGVAEGGLNEEVSRSVDSVVLSQNPFAEDALEQLIRSNHYLYSPTGLALPMILLSMTLARYAQWEVNNYGKWLASAANDPYLDLVPPVVSAGLSRRFGEWWSTDFKALTNFVLSRYVVQQHQSMSYEKTKTGERCLLQVDGARIVSTGEFSKIGMGNPRLGSALQILTDLGLIEEDKGRVLRLTHDGQVFLKRELAKEVVNEVY